MVRREAGSSAVEDFGAVRGCLTAIGMGLAAFLFVAACILYAGPAHATPPNNRPPDNRPPDRGNEQVQLQAQSQQAEAQAAAEASSQSAAVAGAVSGSESSATGGAAHAEGGQGGAGGAGGAGGESSATAHGGTASNEGVTVEGDRVENNSSNVVLVPNNNTSGCMRVYGLSFGNGDGAGALGVPFRDKACDYEQAADDAAAMGEHKIAWWWRCHKKNLWKTFEGDSREMKHLACWNSMVSMLDPKPVASLDDFDIEQLVAQVSKEEYAEQQKLVEDKMAQQQNLIESLKEEHAEDKAEIERLRREAARLRAEQKAQEERDAARRAAALKALAKKSGDDNG